MASTTQTQQQTVTHAKASEWSLIELRLGISFLRSFFKSGMTPAKATAEVATMQAKHAEFWRGASRHTASGKTLHSYLVGKWPDSLVAPMKIAESSGQIQEVMEGMQNTLEQQGQTRAVTKKLVYPAVISVLGAIVGIFFLTTVIPALISPMRFDKEPMIAKISKWVQAFTADYGLITIASACAALAVLIWKWNQDDKLQSWVLSVINKLPVLGWSTRWLWFSVWARYVAIMIKADLGWPQIFRLAALTLPPHLRDLSFSFATQMENGKTLVQAATASKDPEDPRHMLPAHIVNAFRMTHEVGDGAEQFTIAADAMFDPARTTLLIGISSINYTAMSLAAAFITIPMVMYLQVLVAMTTSIVR